MIEIIICLIISYFGITAICLSNMYQYNGNWYLDVIENYESWENLNFATVVVLTLLLNIIFAPYAIIYWLVRFLKFITTVGRN